MLKKFLDTGVRNADNQIGLFVPACDAIQETRPHLSINFCQPTI
jgi:hypothetical protein